MSDDITPDQVMARRFQLVEEKAIVEGRHKAELAPLVEELGLCEGFIKDFMLKSGSQQYKIATGEMAFFSTKDSVTVEDMDTSIRFMIDQAPAPAFLPDPSLWQQVKDHLYANGMWGLLNKALNKTAVKELLEASPPVAPETLGVKFSSYKDLSWRRGK